MEVKIGKIVLSATANGTPKALIWEEGTNYDTLTESIEILGESVIYIATRKIGETIEITTKGKWKNVTVPQDYLDVLSKPAYDRVKLLFMRGVQGIDLALNGTRPSIDMEVAKVMLTDDLDMFLNLQDLTLKTLKKSNTEYAKEVVENIGKPLGEQTVNPYSEINKLTQQSIHNILKDYRIQNEYKDKK